MGLWRELRSGGLQARSCPLQRVSGQLIRCMTHGCSAYDSRQEEKKREAEERRKDSHDTGWAQDLAWRRRSETAKMR